MRLVESIRGSTYPKENIELVVVDDASTDGTSDSITSSYPDVKVIRNALRKMTSGARNVGIRISNGDYLFFVDHDNIVGRETINSLVKFLEDNRNVGIVGPIMYYLSAPREIWCAGGTLKQPLCVQTHALQHEEYPADHMARIKPIECEYIPNAFMLRRQLTVEIGLFDEENFPILWEDIDFGLRIRRKGYKAFIVPEAKIWHDVPKTKDFHIDRERAFLRGRNRARFYVKYGPMRIPLLPFDLLGFCTILLIHGKDSEVIQKLLLYCAGIINGLVPGKKALR